MKKTIEERMIIAEARIEAVERIIGLIKQVKDYEFYTPSDGEELCEWQVHGNAVAQAKIDTYIDLINTILD